MIGRSTCSNAGSHASSLVCTWSLTPGIHTHWLTPLPSQFSHSGSPISHLPSSALAPTGTGAMKTSQAAV